MKNEKKASSLFTKNVTLNYDFHSLGLMIKVQYFLNYYFIIIYIKAKGMKIIVYRHIFCEK